MRKSDIMVRGLTKDYGPKRAIIDLDLRVESGEVYGLVGPNGAGKTTAIRAILGLIKPTYGEVSVLGVDPYRDSEMKMMACAQLENSAVYGGLTALDNLEFIGKLHARPDSRARASELLERFGLAAYASQPAATLSKGMQRKLSLARTLVSDPRVLVFDEPTSGIDPLFQHQFRELVSELSHEGRTVLLSSHNLQEVKELCDRITFMMGGRGVLSGTLKSIARQFIQRKFRVWLKASTKGNRTRSRFDIPELGQFWQARSDEPGVLLTKNPQSLSDVRRLLEKSRIDVERVEVDSADLEDIFDLAEGR